MGGAYRALMGHSLEFEALVSTAARLHTTNRLKNTVEGIMTHSITNTMVNERTTSYAGRCMEVHSSHVSLDEKIKKFTELLKEEDEVRNVPPIGESINLAQDESKSGEFTIRRTRI